MLPEQIQEAQQQQQQSVCGMKRAQVSNMKRLAHRLQTQCHREDWHGLQYDQHHHQHPEILPES